MSWRDLKDRDFEDRFSQITALIRFDTNLPAVVLRDSHPRQQPTGGCQGSLSSTGKAVGDLELNR